MTAVQKGSKVEPVPKRAGRHRRATRRPRLSADQAGIVVKGAYLLVRAVEVVTQHEAPTRWFHHLTGLAVKVVHVVVEFLGN